ncbi:hypothetical protein LTR08_005257 [Meristemomyces frigidus]|nr:hypothetical protein LTR08_005257 [Meristemomyces frigidus]
MPVFREVSMTLQSQYDALRILETAVPAAEVEASSASPSAAPTASVVEVSIPTYASSQFWLGYACLPPPVGGACRYYYFKLWQQGSCVVSWGVGAEEGWGGKTMFGLFEGGTDFEGRRVVEKRAFFFPPRGGEGRGFEVRVYRSLARRRDKAVLGGGGGAGGGALSMARIGWLQKSEPRRHYAYALIDPLETPYCTFRYHLEPATDMDSAPASQRSSSTSGSSSLAYEVIAPGTRLSFPPPVQLRPSTSQVEPSSPVKQPELEPHARPSPPKEGAGSHDDWVVRTPSPVQADRQRYERAATPPSARKKSGSIGLLRGVITNALKRREESRSGESG